MSTLVIVTLNVDGINDNQKRNSIFKTLKEINYDIICLQETHIQQQNINKVKKEWGYTSYWNPGPSQHSGGTAILMGNTDLKIEAVKKDDVGRVTVARLTVCEDSIQVVNIYGPNKPGDREEFFGSIKDYMYDTDHTILIGDFNMVEDIEMDRRIQSQDIVYTQGRKNLTLLKNSYKLRDEWRIQNKKKRVYTWKSRASNGQVESRIDRIYISKELTLMAQNNNENVFTDHQQVTAKIHVPTKTKKGSGYWKMNVELLQDENYIQYITEVINGIKQEHTDTQQQWWENMKHIVQNETIIYCQNRARLEKDEILQLHRQYEHHNDADIRQQILQEITKRKQEQQKGTIIRSREKTILNEDRPTKYFYLQEQVRQNKGHITEVHTLDEEGEIQNTYLTDKEILEILKEHYTHLYSTKQTDDYTRTELLESTTLQLTEEQKREMDKPITLQEIKNAVLDMETNRSPGPDGLPIEFYQKFLPLLQDELLNMINNIFLYQEHQPETQKRGYVKLIYKKGIKYLLINWRGITLLCADHKIMTKIMSARLRKILPHIVIEDQTCAVMGRSIIENLYLIRDTIHYSNYKNIPTYIISYDFQNAFDSIEHIYITETLKKYNFGHRFINFVKNIYTNRKVNVMNNGNFTPTIPVERGLSQGDPLSLPLFCLMAEPLANLAREHEGIKGYHIPGLIRRIKLTQYADDTTQLTPDHTSVQDMVNVFKTFEYASGCELHPEKTKGMALQTNHLPFSSIKIDWNEPEGIKILGIYFFQDLEYAQNFNWTKALKKVESKLQMYKYRNLSLKGKVMMLNSTILSKVWYLSTIFKIPKFAWSDKNGNGLQKMIFKMLWGDKDPEPIKREIIYLPKDRGGLGLLHIMTQGDALRLTHLFNIPKQIKTKLWVYYARYWLGRQLAKCDERWSFLCNNNTPIYTQQTDINHVPYHYVKLLKIFKDNEKDVMEDKDKTTKSMYVILRKKIDETVEVPVQYTWQRGYKKTIIWKKLWKHAYYSYNVGTIGDILYKTLHNCLPTYVRMRKNRNKGNKNVTTCQICGKSDETILHMFARCQYVREIWRIYQYIYEGFLPNVPFNYEDAVITLNIQDTKITDYKRKLILTVTEIILQELWLRRNKCVKENIIPNTRRSIKTINTNIATIIKTHHNYYNKRNNVKAFKDKFAIDNILCEIDYHDKLNLFLPP